VDRTLDAQFLVQEMRGVDGKKTGDIQCQGVIWGKGNEMTVQKTFFFFGLAPETEGSYVYLWLRPGMHT
jgi:hypothetical protein